MSIECDFYIQYERMVYNEKKTVEQVKNWFKILGIEATIKLTGKTITINNESFRMPSDSKNSTSDFTRSMKFESKVIEYIESLFPTNLTTNITSQYQEILKGLQSQQIRIDFSYNNYGCCAARDIKRSIEDAKKLIEYVSITPNFYEIIEQYEAYRNLVENGWEYLQN